MLVKKITYTDYDGNTHTEEFRFNLSKAELVELEHSEKEGYDKLLKRIVDEQNNKELIKAFKEIILLAYGEKSADGKRFVKSKELSDAFAQTEAYSELFMELVSDSDKASAFVNGIMPPMPEEK